MRLSGGLDEDRIRMFCRGCELGLRTESLPEDGETISRQSTALLTVPAESAEGEHPLWLQANVLATVEGLCNAPVLPPKLSGQS